MVRDQIHSSANLLVDKEPPVLIGCGVGWVTGSVWLGWPREITWPSRESKPGHSPHSCSGRTPDHGIK